VLQAWQVFGPLTKKAAVQPVRIFPWIGVSHGHADDGFGQQASDAQTIFIIPVLEYCVAGSDFPDRVLSKVELSQVDSKQLNILTKS
jgi:hypothetical protein